MQPLVSILIPAYNAEAWLGEAIRSALAQTWQKTEIIVIDDGSTDETLARARQFESAQVKVLSHSNQGASVTRNQALSLAQGDYIQWLDADDFLAPDKIAAQLAAIAPAFDSKTLLSSAWCSFYFRPQHAAFTSNALWHDLTPVEWLTLKMKTNAWMAIESWLVNREIAEAAGNWNGTLTMDDDGEYFSRIISAAEKIVFVPEAKSYVRKSNLGSLSKSFSSPGKLESQFQSMKLQITRLRALEDSPRVRAACMSYLQRWLVYFYPEQEEIVKGFHTLAAELGGSLATPVLSWKYVPVQRLFGWTVAKKMSFMMPKARAWCVKEWEKLLNFPSR